MPAISAATRNRFKKEILERVQRRLDDEITQLDGYSHDGYMTCMTSSICETVSSGMSSLVDEALKDWSASLDREETLKSSKLTAENKKLKDELKELKAIRQMLENAKAGNDD